MIDPRSATGIALELIKLAGRLPKLWKEFRCAKQDLKKVRKRAKMVAGMYDFFIHTMEHAEGIEELAPIFKRHHDLVGSVKSEAQHTIERLQDLIDFFTYKVTGRTVSPIQKWIARFKWSRTTKEVVAPLFQDMKILEKSMGTLGILVHIHILKLVYEKDKSDFILGQLDSFKEMLNVEFKKLERAQRTQRGLLRQTATLRNRELTSNEFSREILRFLRTEISAIHDGRIPNEPSTSDSSSPPRSPKSNRPHSTMPPSSSHHNGDGRSFTSNSHPGPESLPRRKVKVSRTTRPEDPQPPNGSSILPQSRSPPPPATEFNNQDNRPDGEVYQPEVNEHHEIQESSVPPFEYVSPDPDPGPRRPSERPPQNLDPNTPNGSQNRHRETPRHYLRQLGPSAPRRRNGGMILPYGSEGDVTATHKTGFVGLPPTSSWSRKGKWRAED